MLHVSYIFKLERNKSSIKPKIKESRQPYRVEQPKSIRDQPFNLKGGLWFFLSFRNFRTTQELEYLFISQIFFQNLTLGYMTKTLIFFFPSPTSEYFFQQHWESEYVFRKNQVKWSLPNIILNKL
jgi:hypothetical protein